MKYPIFRLLTLCFFLAPFFLVNAPGQQKATWAERLGWPQDSRVLLIHVDDAGMCHDANVGAIEALEKGIATSTSVMMPCPWVPEIVAYIKQHSSVDAGIHLTLNAEWKLYRWGPLAGRSAVPSLVDEEGCLKRDTASAVMKGSAEEVEKELRAQLERARSMGFEPTHLDSHMGTVIAPPFIDRYIKLGIEQGIPVMLPAGHMQHIAANSPGLREQVRPLARKLWEAGLPLIDDVMTDATKGKNYEEMKGSLVTALRSMSPGISYLIVHCTRPSDTFSFISNSGDQRLGELQLMLDPEIKSMLKDLKISTTTWRELKGRRQRAGNVAF